ncbi:MAG: hypothetical protein ACYCXG_05230 [Acidiferrobacter sp.]
MATTVEEMPEDLRQSLARVNRRNDPRFWRAREAAIRCFYNGCRHASGDGQGCRTQNDYLMAKTRLEHKKRVKVVRTACGKKSRAPDAASRLTEAKQATEAWAFREHQTGRWRDAIRGLFVAWINGTEQMPAPDHKRMRHRQGQHARGNTFNAFCLARKTTWGRHHKDVANLTFRERRKGVVRDAPQRSHPAHRRPASPLVRSGFCK